MFATATKNSPTFEPEPKVAVLRFSNLGPESDTPIVDGIAEDILNALAKFGTFGVLGRNTSFSLGTSELSDENNIARRAGARYYVSGSVRVGERLTVSVSLLNVQSGDVLWNDRFSASGPDIFEVVEQVALRVVNRLVARLADVTITKASPVPTKNLAAYELLLRGLAKLRGYADGDNEAARDYFLRALESDAEYAIAHAHLALTEVVIAGYSRAGPTVIQEATKRAQHAVTLRPEEPRCQRILGLISAIARRFEAAEHHIRISLSLNPYDANTICDLGYLLTVRGRASDGIAAIERAIAINPVHPSWYFDDLSLAQYSAGQYAEAAATIRKIQDVPLWMMPRLAAAYAQAAQIDRANEVIEDILSQSPNFSFANFAQEVAFEHEADLKRLEQGLSLALDAWRDRASPS